MIEKIQAEATKRREIMLKKEDEMIELEHKIHKLQCDYDLLKRCVKLLGIEAEHLEGTISILRYKEKT